MELFQRLGRDIESRWLEQNYNESAFPEIAASCLKEAALPDRVSPWEIVEWALKERDLPRQRDVAARFADPPLTLFSGQRFHIDLYFWFDGTTSIHQHAFCGAFQVLMGSSIHSWYAFETSDVINSFCELGRLDLKVCELLSVGSIQEIWPGKDYVHSLFHLDRPSATIVIRTDKSPKFLPQFSYRKPNFAYDPFFERDTLTKKFQLVSALLRAGRPDADGQIADLLEQSDLQTCFSILANARHFLKSDPLGEVFNAEGSKTRFDALLSAIESRHGKGGAALRAVFERDDLVDDIMTRRAYISDPEQRFFMALLLNVDGRDLILDLVSSRFPGSDPVEKILDWTFDLSQIRIFGAQGENALGIAEFGDPELTVLEDILRGGEASELRSQHPDAFEKVEGSPVFRPLMT